MATNEVVAGVLLGGVVSTGGGEGDAEKWAGFWVWFVDEVGRADSSMCSEGGSGDREVLRSRRRCWRRPLELMERTRTGELGSWLQGMHRTGDLFLKVVGEGGKREGGREGGREEGGREGGKREGGREEREGEGGRKGRRGARGKKGERGKKRSKRGRDGGRGEVARRV